LSDCCRKAKGIAIASSDEPSTNRASTRRKRESGRLKYMVLARTLERDIQSGKYRRGDQIPSERELCRTFGVANYTLRQALDLLAGKGLLSREQGRGTFVRDPAGEQDAPQGDRRSLRSILLLGLGPDDPEWSDPGNWEQRLRRYQGIVEAGFRFNIPIVSRNASGHEVDVAWLLEAIGERGGLIADNDTAHPVSDAALLALRERGVPVVMINRLENPLCSEVRVDIHRGSYLAAAHLLDQGHRRIALLLGARNVFMAKREQGYEEALRDRGLEPDPSLTMRTPAGTLREIEQATTVLLGRPDPPTAIVAANDLRAFALLEVLRQRGIRVPEELSVIGFDDLANAAREQPPLTTVRNPLYEAGYEAVRLVRSLHQDPGEDIRLRTLKMELVVRRSTAPIRS